jgi:putative oxidoreductase
MLHIKIPAHILRPVLKLLDDLTPVADLLARIWVAKIFFLSGLTKISDWQTTIMLFTHQYHVPLLSPTYAAYLGTSFELILPIFLVLGLGGRFLIFIFFIYNIVCMISFHFLWTPEGYAGLSDHINWALLLMLLMCHGSGKISLDYLIREKWGHHLKRK